MRFALFLFALIGLGSSAVAEDGPMSAPVYYIGFNYFTGDGGDPEVWTFSHYIEQVEPIMARYGMTLETYRVANGRTNALPAHAITFGAAPDQERFAAFFADPDFQEIFPMLTGIIENHTVIFTPEPYSLKDAEGLGETVFSVGWIKPGAEHRAAVEDGDAQMRQVGEAYGLALLTRAAGLMANEGLAAEITEVTPPDYIELWRIEDPHGLLNDPQYKETVVKARAHVEKSASYWLAPWK